MQQYNFPELLLIPHLYALYCANTTQNMTAICSSPLYFRTCSDITLCCTHFLTLYTVQVSFRGSFPPPPRLLKSYYIIYTFAPPIHFGNSPFAPPSHIFCIQHCSVHSPYNLLYTVHFPYCTLHTAHIIH